MSWRSALVLAVNLAISLSLCAQDLNERSVSGVVTGVDKRPVDGAVVQIKDLKSLQIRSYITDNGGEYHFAGLSTNTDYELKAHYRGNWSDTKTLSAFSSKKQTTINLKIEKD